MTQFRSLLPIDSCLRLSLYYILIGCVHFATSRRRSLPPIETQQKASGDLWTLHCPHVQTPAHQLAVSWLFNSEMWMKIADGKILAQKELQTYASHPVGKEHVISVKLFDDRYHFHYNEVVGDFFLEILPVYSDDSGVWQCVIDYQRSSSGEIEALQSTVRLNVTGALKPAVAAAVRQNKHLQNKPPEENDDTNMHNNNKNGKFWQFAITNQDDESISGSSSDKQHNPLTIQANIDHNRRNHGSTTATVHTTTEIVAVNLVLNLYIFYQFKSM